jgi:hypothetical protein
VGGDYDGVERRDDAQHYDGPERRRFLRRMTDDELQGVVHDLAERVETLEEERDRLKLLPDAVAELKGAVQTLSGLVTLRFDGLQGPVEKAASVKTAVQFAAIVLVPIIVALLGGYFALRAGGGTR